MNERDIPCGPVVKTLCLQYRDCRFGFWLGDQDPVCRVARKRKKKMLRNIVFGNGIIKPPL